MHNGIGGKIDIINQTFLITIDKLKTVANFPVFVTIFGYPEDVFFAMWNIFQNKSIKCFAVMRVVIFFFNHGAYRVFLDVFCVLDTVIVNKIGRTDDEFQKDKEYDN